MRRSVTLTSHRPSGPSWSDLGCGLVGCAAFVVAILLAVTIFAGSWALGEWLGWHLAHWFEGGPPA